MIHKLLTAAIVVVLFAPALGNAGLQQWEIPVVSSFLVCEGALKPGCQYFRAGDFKAALNVFKPLAEGSQPGAQNNLGVLYESGAGVSKSKPEALRWYRKAAAANVAIAQYNLAVLLAADHLLGTADPSRRSQDFIEAYMLLELAESQGVRIAADGRQDLLKHMSNDEIARARERLGKGHVKNGRATALDIRYAKAEAAYDNADYATALAELRPLAAKGHAEAQTLLANMYYDGLGVPQDYHKAAEWHRRAAEQGDAYGQYNLALMYEEGLGVSRGHGQAARWYFKAAQQNSPFAQNNLAVLYQYGRGVKQDIAKAYFLYAAAALQFSLLEEHSEERAMAAENRDNLKRMMSQEQLENAHRLGAEWLGLKENPSPTE